MIKGYVMTSSKTGGLLKGIFDPAKKAAAAAVMEPESQTAAAVTLQPPDERIDTPSAARARNRKAGGRNVRISGYIPPEIEASLRDEVIRRTVAERKTISMNDVLCDALTFWQQQGRSGH